MKVAGLLSEKIMTDSHTLGYDLVNLETAEKEIFLRQNADYGSDTIGRFTISAKGLSFGNAVIKSTILSENTIVIIDEVGLLEIGNNGWYESLNDLIEKSGNHIILVVRDIYVQEVKNKWNLKEANIVNINETNYRDTGLSIIESMNPKPCD